MFKFINKILKDKKSGMPIDRTAHLLVLKILKDISKKYNFSNKMIQLSNDKCFVEEINSINLDNPKELKKYTNLEYSLLMHSPTFIFLGNTLNNKALPSRICLMIHNYYSLDHLLTKIGSMLGLTSSDPNRFLKGQKVIELFKDNGYGLVFDEGSFFSSKMISVLLPNALQKIYGKYLSYWEDRIKRHIFRSMSRNRFMVFVKDEYTPMDKGKLNYDYIKETINFDNKYNKKTFYGKFYFENVKRLMEVSKPTADKVVLDLGTGTGTFSILAAKKGSFVYALDISKQMISIARNKSKKLGLSSKIKFVCADAENLPFKNNFFDLIYTASVPHDVNDFDKYLKEIHRVLKSNGKVYMNLFNFFTPAGLYLLINILFKRIQKLNFVTRRVLEDKTKSVGLKIKGRFGIELFQGLPIPWKMRWKIYSKNRGLEKKLAFSKFNFIYSQFYYILTKI